MLSFLPVAGIVIASFIYLIITVRLLREIEVHHPAIWHDVLKSPRRILISWLPESINIFTIKPIWPYFVWLMMGHSKPLNPTAKILFWQSRLILLILLGLLWLHALYCC